MKRKILYLFLMFSIFSSYAVIVDLTKDYKIEGEIVSVNKSELILVADNCLFYINTNLISGIHNGDTEGNEALDLEELALKEWAEPDISIYEDLYKVGDDYMAKSKIYNHMIVPANELKSYPVGNYVKMLDGSEFTGEFKMKRPILSIPHILLENETKIYFSEIECYQYREEFFQRIPSSFSANKFAKRVLKGKIDFYSSVTLNKTPGFSNTISTPGGDFTTLTPGTSSLSSVDYFRKGNGDLEKASYKNLAVALKDNKESMRYLSQYKTLNRVQWGMTLGGIGLVVGGLSQIDKEDGLTSGGKALMISGGIISGIGQIFGLKKPEKIMDAIEVYNN